MLDQNSVDMLFGLDMLKRHQCMIDLKVREPLPNVRGLSLEGVPLYMQNHSLHLEGANGRETVEFLPENEIPKDNFPRAAGEAEASASSGAQSSGGNAQPSASPQSSSQQGGQTQVHVDANKLEQLVSLGFSRNEAAEALVVCQGDVDMAASYLLQNSGQQQ